MQQKEGSRWYLKNILCRRIIFLVKTSEEADRKRSLDAIG